MQNLIPGNMLEVNQKLKWELDNGMTADEDSVINDAILAGTQYYTDEALEGHYWTVKWNAAHTAIDLFASIDNVAGTLKPTGESFVADFRQDSQGLFIRIEQAVAVIVREN